MENDALHNPRAIQYRKEIDKCLSLFVQKNEEYGDTIKKTGVLGASVELIGTCARLPKLVLRSASRGRDNDAALRNVFMDIANYAVIALIMMSENNWEGVD
jgi:hypothetical protein